MKLHELAVFTNEVDALADFYERLLDAKPLHCGDGIALFKVGDVEILIHARYDPASGDPPCESHTAFIVTDLEQAVAALEMRGLTVDFPARHYEWGRSAYLRDPEGRLLELYERATRTESAVADRP